MLLTIAPDIRTGCDNSCRKKIIWARTPGVSVPSRTRIPPNRSTNPMVTRKAVSTVEPLSASNWIALNICSDSLKLFRSNFFCSKSLAPKALTTLTPVKFSCKIVFSSPNVAWTFSQANLIRTRTMLAKISTNGRRPRPIRPSCRSKCNIITLTVAISNRKYGALTIVKFTNIRIASMSVIARDIKLPVCCLSWKAKLKCCKWS